MNRIRLIILLIFSFVVICVHSMEAEDTIPEPERITLKFDKKNGCFLGDTIRFTVSLDSATAYSSVAYVDLVHPTGTVLCSRKLRLDRNYRATGWIAVDSIYGTGFYELRAYTRFLMNWRNLDYPSYVLPIYLPEHKIPINKRKEDERYIDQSKITNNIYSTQFSGHRKLSFKLSQPIEQRLIIFGQILPKSKKYPTREFPLGNKHFNIIVGKGDKSFSGRVETDSLGYYALYMPDTLHGSWNLFMYENWSKKKNMYLTSEMAQYHVRLNEDFAPPPRKFRQDEIQPKRFGFKKFHDDRQQSKTMIKLYNCDNISLAALNAGEIAWTLYSWLGIIDNNFSRTKGMSSPTRMNIMPDATSTKFLDITFPNGYDSNDKRTVCVDGPGYKKRPVVWIVDGKYRLVTGLNKTISDFKVIRPSQKNIPTYIDEVRLVLITDSPTAFLPYVRCSVLEKKKPITIFITTHEDYIWNDSGLMSTHFRGYDN